MEPLDVPAPALPTVPPRAPRHTHTATVHGEMRRDEFHWLRNRKNPRVIKYLEAENQWTEQQLRVTEPLQDRLYNEMRSRIKEDDVSVPIQRGEYFYYYRVEADKQYEIHCRKRGEAGPEEITLDENSLVAGDFLAVSVEYSPDGRYLAYGVDTAGDEHYTVRIRDLHTGQDLPDVIQDVCADDDPMVVWGVDNDTFYYLRPDDTDRPYQLCRHTLGGVRDALLYQEDDDTFALEIDKSDSERFLVLTVMNTETIEQHLLDLSVPAAPLQRLVPRAQGVQYAVADHGDGLYITTNDAAPNFRLMTAPLTTSDRGDWREVVPERADTTLLAIDVHRDHLVSVERRADGLVHLSVRKLSTGEEHEVSFPDADYSVELDAAAEPSFESNVIRLFYNTLTKPTTTYDYNLDTRQFTERKVKEVPGFDSSLYMAEKIWATAGDGTRIPISIVRRRDAPRDGTSPVLLEAYGAYGYPFDASFDRNVISLLDRGFTYAIAHPRGGGELGEPWRKSGNMHQKMNTFTDFIACAEHLLANGWTTPSRLVATGASAGGLLMGGVANMRPDLFRAIVASVPFVDVVNTMLDEDIPGTTSEFEEWGNPKNVHDYNYISRYSPYDNVGAHDYPWMLVTAGLNDPRVQYWEPAKWVARLRATKTDTNPLLLKTDMAKGHFGPSGRYDEVRRTALEYAFMLAAVGRNA